MSTVGRISHPGKLEIESSIQGNHFGDIVTETIFEANGYLYKLTEIAKQGGDGLTADIYLHQLERNIVPFIPKSELEKDAKAILKDARRMVQIGHYSRRKLHLAKNLLLRDLVRLGLFSSSPEIEEEVATHMRHRREMAEEAKQA